MEILDGYGKEEAAKALHDVQEYYRQCSDLKAELEAQTKDDASRAKEQSLAEFELKEIEDAELKAGEDESLEQQYRLMVNGRKIAENLSESYQMTGSDMEDSAGNRISRALRALGSITMYDDRLVVLEGQLAEIENLLSDYNKDVSEYMAQCDFDREDFERVEGRLNTINRLKGKYGNTVEEIQKYADERRRYLDRLNDYDSYMAELNVKYEQTKGRLEKACEKLSEIRTKNASTLQKLLKEAMQGLNFATVEFEIAVRPRQNITAAGYDDVEFMISTNPGEPLKSLGSVASGGELSRIMLAIKTVLASRDKIPTMIFDEIDTGISGKTAWKVSEKLGSLSRSHQIICITHLPQIAAMSDSHYKIAKQAVNNKTETHIFRLNETETVDELARMLGSDEITDTVRENARELINTARNKKMSVK
jgi:DNA repair protein RecN (Recombination protein N)